MKFINALEPPLVGKKTYKGSTNQSLQNWAPCIRFPVELIQVTN